VIARVQPRPGRPGPLRGGRPGHRPGLGARRGRALPLGGRRLVLQPGRRAQRLPQPGARGAQARHLHGHGRVCGGGGVEEKGGGGGGGGGRRGRAPARGPPPPPPPPGAPPPPPPPPGVSFSFSTRTTRAPPWMAGVLPLWKRVGWRRALRAVRGRKETPAPLVQPQTRPGARTHFLFSLFHRTGLMSASSSYCPPGRPWRTPHRTKRRKRWMRGVKNGV